MARRRSARLASAAKPNKATPELPSVAEGDEPHRSNQKTTAVPSSPAPVPSTPASSAIKPPYDEMHPHKAHQTTGAPDSALRLGFTDIQPDSTQKNRRTAQQDATPSKVNRVQSSAFTFRVSPRDTQSELSSDAQALMAELREQAAKIKADMVAEREAAGEGDVADRKIIKPKGKAGRFSAAHMAEFKKMDSIEGHASAWRAQEGRFTPIKSALKRSPSKADLDATPTPIKSALQRSTSKPTVDATPTPARVGLKRSPSKVEPDAILSSPSKRTLKRKSSVANLDAGLEQPAPKTSIPASPSKIGIFNRNSTQQSAVKRLKQRLEDDSSVARPVSRDGSGIPQPSSGSGPLRSQSTLARLTSPTKASLAHTGSNRKPTISLVQPAIPQPDFGGLVKSASSQSVTSPSVVSELKRRIISPGRFQKVKSILRGQKPDASAIPQPAISVSQTPGPRGSEKMLLAAPFTTPRRKLVKHVSFTPEAKEAAAAQNSPSPQKFGSSKFRFRHNANDSQFPNVANVLAQSEADDVVYPDLSSLERRTLGTTVKSDDPPSKPGTFTFRSDHTIEFGVASPTGFGASPGQSSVRQVRSSVVSSSMPGTFPDMSKDSISDKENDPPAASRGLLAVPHGISNKKRHRAGSDEEDAEREASRGLLGVPHGMSNKKRHRAISDEEDAEREASERAAKKRKNETVPDGQVLLKTRPLGTTPLSSAKTAPRGPSQTPSRTPLRTPSKTPLRTPSQAPASASAAKKRTLLSISRLNMLARPKNRA